MKIKRIKGYRRILDLYTRHFGLVIDPLEVFVDSTFANQALINKLSMYEQFECTLKVPVKLVTSSCVINECEKLSPVFNGALTILQNLKLLKCKHVINAKECAASCIKRRLRNARKSTTNKKNENILFGLATNDERIQAVARNISGIPVFYIAHNRINLEPIPLETSRLLENMAVLATDISAHDANKIKEIKAMFGVPEAEVRVKKKKRGPCQPNPLSCRKKAMNPVSEKHSSARRRRRRRKRIKNTWALQQVISTLKAQLNKTTQPPITLCPY